jgi:hypothetical protein
MKDPESRFQEWIEVQNQTWERKNLHNRLRQYDRAEFFSYLAILAWVAGMFVAYRLGWVDAAVAGLVTLWSFVAGGYVVWQIKIRQRAVRSRLGELEKE